MKKILLLLMMGVMGAMMHTHAYTAQEIAAKGHVTWGQKFDYDENVGGYLGNLYSNTGGDLPVSVNSDGQLEVEYVPAYNYYSELQSIKFILKLDVSGSTVTVANSLMMPLIWYGDMYTVGRTQRRAVIESPFHLVSKNSGATTFYGISPLNSEKKFKNTAVSGTITKDSDDNFIISLEAFDIVKCTATNGTVYVFDYNYQYSGVGNNFTYYDAHNKVYSTNGFDMRTYKANGTMSFKEYSVDNDGNLVNPVEYNSLVNVKIKDDVVKVDNFLGYGRPYESWAPNSSNGWWTRQDNMVNGKCDMNSLTFSLYPAELMMNFYNTDFPDYIFALTLNSDIQETADGYLFGTLDGYIDGEAVEHQGPHKWMDQESTCTLIKNPKLVFNDAMYITENVFISLNECGFWDLMGYDDVKIDLDEDLEYTHSHKIQKNQFGYGNGVGNGSQKYIYINCALGEHKNTAFVEDYELYIVPGEHAVIGGADFMHEDGHVNGTRIDLEQYATAFMPNTARTMDVDVDGDGGQGLERTYNLLIPENDLKAIAADGKYSLYTRTKYTAESGLEDSFHALTPLGETTTAVGTITTDDLDAPVEYFTLQGVRVDNPLPGAVYVRRQGSHATKVRIN